MRKIAGLLILMLMFTMMASAPTSVWAEEITAPEATSITKIYNTTSGIKLMWKSVPDADGYRVYRGGELIADVSSTSYIDTSADLMNGSGYQYAVAAYKVGPENIDEQQNNEPQPDESLPDEPQLGEPQPNEPQPNPTPEIAASAIAEAQPSEVRKCYRLTRPSITSFTVSAENNGTVKWSRNAKASGYEIKYVAGSTTKTVTVSGAAMVSKVLKTLTGGRTYKVYVRAYKTVSGVKYYSAYSAVKSRTTHAYKGFTNINGYLYYYSKGLPVKNRTVSGIRLGASGRYSSGSTKLDTLIRGLIKKYTTSSMTQKQKLQKLYLYVANRFTYKNTKYYDVGATGWERSCAYTALTYRSGNCYSYASAVTMIARALGFNAKAKSGYVVMDGKTYRHGWCEITYGGRVYICDAQVEGTYARNVGHNWDLFFKRKSQVVPKYRMYE